MTGNGVYPSVSRLGPEPRQLIERLVELVRVRPTEQRDALPVLTNLSVALTHRFEREDDDFDAAMQRAPWVTGGVRQLKEQHGQLMHLLNGLQQTLQAGDCSMQWPEELGDRVDEFVELYHEHEAAEDSLLQESCDQPFWTLDD